MKKKHLSTGKPDHLSDEWLSLASEITGMGQLIWFPEKKEFNLDTTSAKLLVIQDNELISEEIFLSNIHPDDQKKVIELLNPDHPDNQQNQSIRFRVTADETKKEKILEYTGKFITLPDNNTYFIGYLKELYNNEKATTVPSEYQKFEIVFESANVAKSITYISGRINVNQAFCDILGYTREELNQKRWQEITPPEDVPAIEKQLEKMLKSNQNSIRFNKRYLHKKGFIKWGDVNVVVHRDELNQPEYFITTFVDITERVKAEEEIKRNEHVLTLFVEHTPAAVAMFDRKMRYMVASKRFLIDYDLGDQEIIGRTHYEIFPEIPERWKKIHQECLKGKTMRADEDPFPRANGNLDWIKWEIRPWYKETGRVGGMILFSEVITERKMAREELRKERDRFLNLAATAPGAICAYRLNPDGSNCMPYASPKIKEITGFSPEELACDASCMIPLVHPEDSETVGRSIYESAKNLTTWKSEYQYNHPEKGWIWIEVHSVPTRTSNGSTTWYGFINDVTDRKNAERLLVEKNQEYQALNEEYLTLNEELEESLSRLQNINQELEEAKEKAEESDNLKSIFLANMSHEVRTPLNAILGFSKLLSRRELPVEKKKYYAELIENSGDRLLRLINDIIDISKLESGQISLDIKEYKIFELVDSCFRSLEKSALRQNKQNIRFHLHFPEDYKNYTTKTDRIRFQQVLDNLLTNALKYTESGSVEVGVQPVRDERGTGKIRIYVKDTGPGIPKEKHHLIFKRFRQVEEHGFHEGTGLGLSISKGITDLLGEDIGFYSEENAGTIFYFTTTIHNDEAGHILSGRKKAETEHPNIENKTIFIAEDDFYSFAYLKELLDGNHVKIKHASNGKELIRLLNTSAPDLILLDINMPVMNGFECMEVLKKKNLQIPVIAQTAYAQQEERKRCLKAGCQGYISKPIKRNELFRVISKVLKQGT